MNRVFKPRSRAFWLRQLHRWHWVSAAISLSGMVLFAVTGITLNHAAQIKAQPEVIERRAVLPEPLRRSLAENPAVSKAPVPSQVAGWLSETFALHIDARQAEWSGEEVYVSLPRPGGDAWLSIERESGEVVYENTNRGWISYLNDLHKGRNAGKVWTVFLDTFAAACIVFSVTGFWLLKLNAGARSATWPLMSLGVIIPLLVAILFVH
jgi:hypothetical protein